MIGSGREGRRRGKEEREGGERSRERKGGKEESEVASGKEGGQLLSPSSHYYRKSSSMSAMLRRALITC